MVEEVVSYLALDRGGIFVDATVGSGGHSAAIAASCQRSKVDYQIIGFDADPRALTQTKNRWEKGKVVGQLIEGNFRNIAQLLAQINITAVDGIIADLGMSSFALDDSERGFSFRRAGPLDMRFGVAGVTAATLIKSLSERELADLIFQYGEERRSRQIAQAIVRYRKEQPITTTIELQQIVASVTSQSGRLNPATRTFQALRIAVNDELVALEDFLPQAVSLLKPGGRVVIITYHSLEDRIVKRFFKSGNLNTLNVLTKKVIRPTRQEVLANPRSRSAKLRAASRLL